MLDPNAIYAVLAGLVGGIAYYCFKVYNDSIKGGFKEIAARLFLSCLAGYLWFWYDGFFPLAEITAGWFAPDFITHVVRAWKKKMTGGVSE